MSLAGTNRQGFASAKNPRLTARVAVERELVDGSTRNAREYARVGCRGDVAAELLRGLLTIEGKEVSTEASNVGGSHRSSRDGVLWMEVSLNSGN